MLVAMVLSRLVSLSIGHMAGSLLAFGLPEFCEFCCPCGLLCVISGLLAGGSLGFRTVLCCCLLTDLKYGNVRLLVLCVFFISAIPIPGMIQCYHPAFSSRRYPTGQPSILLCFVVLVCVFCLVLLFCGVLFCLVPCGNLTAYWTVYRSVASLVFCTPLSKRGMTSLH